MLVIFVALKKVLSHWCPLKFANVVSRILVSLGTLIYQL